MSGRFCEVVNHERDEVLTQLIGGNVGEKVENSKQLFPFFIIQFPQEKSNPSTPTPTPGYACKMPNSCCLTEPQKYFSGGIL